MTLIAPHITAYLRERLPKALPEGRDLPRSRCRQGTCRRWKWPLQSGSAGSGSDLGRSILPAGDPVRP
jgi:hypothetical protein